MEDHVPPLVWTSPELFHFGNSVPSDEEDFDTDANSSADEAG